jgi:hypothetical protein
MTMTGNRMTDRMTDTGPALARPRALGAPVSTVAPVSTAWPTVTFAARATSYRCSDLRPATHNSNHNSIRVSDVVLPVPAALDDFGAAKQGAPPRGVPR